MNGIFYIPNRLNWIDWAKCFAITFVVFGHIPEESGSFLVCYITQFHMPLFFFISGLLTKTEFLNKSTIKKYWNSLIIPYICYNLLFYPYWVLRHIIECPHQNWYDYAKPIIGTIMLQHTTSYYESLNGVTWFISELIIMKIILALSHHIKFGGIIIYFLSIFTASLFIINEFNRYIIDLPFIGFIRCFPFFILGNICKEHKYISDLSNKRKDFTLAVIGIIISLYTFKKGFNNDIISYGIYFWIINISAIGGVLSICRLLSHIYHKIVQNISIGTIAIMGLHWMLIGFTNYLLEKTLDTWNITYPWYIALLLSLFYITILYPIIILFKEKYPFMLGKKSSPQNCSK